MKRYSTLAIAFALGAFVHEPGAAQGFYVYPAQGQTQEQTEQDKFACYQWAQGETGFDPAQAQAPTGGGGGQSSSSGGSSVAKGAVGGGLVGLGVGALAGSAGKGAAIGAVGGGLIGGLSHQDKQKKEAEAANQRQQQAAAQYNQGLNEYNRAYAACLEARGYTVR